MIICRFTTKNTPAPRYGLLERDEIQPLAGAPFADIITVGAAIPLTDAQLCAPVAPTKIVCVGRNYRDHAAELGNPMPPEPLLFLKAPSSLIGPGENIVVPPVSAQVEHEGELGVVIGRIASRLAETEDPLDYVLGYTCVNDVTARDIQRQDVQFTRGKSFDTFCPVGPYIVTGLNPLALDVTTRLNGQVKQNGNTSAMAFDAPYLIRYISHAMTLFPGDIIATGTPAGVSRMLSGDIVEVEVKGVGILQNQVVAL